jgi:hypothetical protein
MDELTAFVAARLDEEEAAAKGPPGWRLEHWTAVRYADKESGRNWRVDAEPRCIVDAVAKEDAEHIARHDPARALREVAAGRRILARYMDCLARMEDPDYPQAVARDQAREYEDFVLPNLAAVWDGHPDYRPEWKP